MDDSDLLNIAVVAACPFPCPRGTPTRILRLCEGLAERGHRIHVLTYHLGSDYAPRHANLTIHRIAAVPSYTKLDPGPSLQKLLVLDAMLVRKLRALLHREDIDVIHGHHYEGLLVASIAARQSRVPIVYDAHTLLESELPFYGRAVPTIVKSSLGTALDRSIPRIADGIICVTEQIERSLKPLARAPDRIITIPNGVELDIFSLRRIGMRSLRKSPGDVRTILYAGSLSEYQGIDRLLRIFAHIAASRTDVRLRVVTDSDFRPYEKLCRQLQIESRVDVVRAGLHELARLIADADVAVNPRVECDGLPQKNLNYMASGVPIVCFQGSAKLLRDRETAYVVPDDDEASFAAAILYAIELPEEAAAMGKRGRAYAEQHCSWEFAAQTTDRFLRDIVKTVSRPAGRSARP